MSLQGFSIYSLTALTPLSVVAQQYLANQTPKPNIVLIMTDDQGWGDVQFNGNELIQTPALNSLHKESAVFKRFYATPVSATTRASLLTGRYHLRTGSVFVQSGLEKMHPEETTIAEVLKQNGYATGCFGKWHNGAHFPSSPNGQGFDEFLGFTSGHWANYFDPELQHNEKQTQRKGYITDIFTDAALQFIESNKNRPFLCYVPYNAPHSPFQVPDRYFNKYDMFLPIQNTKDRAIVASVYGMVENVDYNISRIIQRLDELKLRENTIIVFLTDNGPALNGVPRYNGLMRGSKGEVHEGGVRVPCLINWKGSISAREIPNPASVIDIMPTLLELCKLNDVKTKFPLDGVSLNPLLQNGTGNFPVRKLFTHRYTGKMSEVTGALRFDNLCLTVLKDSVLLFDLSKDTSQKNNFFDKHNGEHAQLLTDYRNWYKEASSGFSPSVVIPVGYKQAPEVRISATDGNLFGKLNINGAPNDNWVNGFQSKSDSLTIDVDFVNNGKYQFEIVFSNLELNKYIVVNLSCNNKLLSRQLPQFVPKRLPDNDRVNRKQEAYPQTWGCLKLGELKMPTGKYRLQLYIEHANVDKNIQIRRIIITKKK
jgi:arylsulfatase A-like enzyme